MGLSYWDDFELDPNEPSVIRYDPNGVAWTQPGWEDYLREEWKRMPVVKVTPLKPGEKPPIDPKAAEAAGVDGGTAGGAGGSAPSGT